MTQDPPRIISVLSSTDGCVGFLRSAGPKGFTAYFHDKHAAVEAITPASA